MSDAKNTRPLRLYGCVDDSIVDGPGVRLAIFTQGCSRQCPGCHNPESQPYDTGYPATIDSLMDMVDANPLLTGVTLSGGEPFDQAEALIPFVVRLHVEKPLLSLWAYSGYLFEELCAGVPSAEALGLLELLDVLVDSPYIESLRSLDLLWKGSENQRIIDVPASLQSGKAIIMG
ncbi:MAG: anaerobic ribonucleoside-triphosphate reductase activating protein [Coriobacteriia bacterium]|nr:anaerobic ribonucleoside-triphosphate reductase activating protein [Coriobacteriia bacterium]